MSLRMQIFIGVCPPLLRMVEAFPTQTKAQKVARCLLKEIVPQFGIPVSIESDNGPAFVAVSR
jgi:hypothetical protein